MMTPGPDSESPARVRSRRPGSDRYDGYMTLRRRARCRLASAHVLSVYGCSLSLSASIDEVNDSAAQASMDEVIDSTCGKDTVRLIEACGFDCCFAADNLFLVAGDFLRQQAGSQDSQDANLRSTS